jgi:PPOX class probable F420-dependent enzyme
MRIPGQWSPPLGVARHLRCPWARTSVRAGFLGGRPAQQTQQRPMRQVTWTLRWKRRSMDVDSAGLAKERFVSITTFKRDGTPVSVPVWCAADNGTLLVFSEADSWKVKRIRRDAHVRLAPCSARGTPRGPAVDADANLVEETTKVQALLARKYPWAWPAYRALMVVTAAVRRLRRQTPRPWLTIRITPRASGSSGS